MNGACIRGEWCSTLVAAPCAAGAPNASWPAGATTSRFVEAAEDSPSGLRKRLTHGRTYRQAVPYLFLDDRPVGGLAEIRALGGSGTLEHLVRDEL